MAGGEPPPAIHYEDHLALRPSGRIQEIGRECNLHPDEF